MANKTRSFFECGVEESQEEKTILMSTYLTIMNMRLLCPLLTRHDNLILEVCQILVFSLRNVPCLIRKSPKPSSGLHCVW